MHSAAEDSTQQQQQQRWFARGAGRRQHRAVFGVLAAAGLLAMPLMLVLPGAACGVWMRCQNPDTAGSDVVLVR